VGCQQQMGHMPVRQFYLTLILAPHTGFEGLKNDNFEALDLRSDFP